MNYSLFLLTDTVMLDKMLDLLKFILAFVIPGATFLGATKMIAKEVLQGQVAMKIRQSEIAKLVTSDEEILERLNSLALKVNAMEARSAISKETFDEFRDDFKEFQKEVRTAFTGRSHR